MNLPHILDGRAHWQTRVQFGAGQLEILPLDAAVYQVQVWSPAFLVAVSESDKEHWYERRHDERERAVIAAREHFQRIGWPTGDAFLRSYVTQVPIPTLSLPALTIGAAQ